jgi:AraC-like DNA-binding protein
MEKNNDHRSQLSSISDVHRLFDLPRPLHPLISLIDNTHNQIDLNRLPRPHILNFYKISYRSSANGRLRYGQGYYDFEDGGLMFAAPNQVISTDEETYEHTGYTLLIHPDFFLGHPMARKIREYGFFSYAANEALHLSEKEKETIVAIFHIMEEELNSRIDDFSQHVVIAQIELLLSYAERFYKRQFITRKAASNDLLQKLEALLEAHFSNQNAISKGIPTVQELADRLNMSASYLSDMLRSLTGQNAQQLIHHRLIEKAKEILSTSNSTVAEVAYLLGFEHPQSFSRLFKTKTNLTPLEFRKSFN